jgi:nitrite reductase [NAD(P)H] large subunit
MALDSPFPDAADGRERLVIVGAGMAGARLLAELARHCPDRYAVTVLGAEAHDPYNRILLSSLLAGEREAADLVLEDAAALAGTRFRLGDPVIALDREQRVAATRSGARIAYDRLVLALGSGPVRPNLPGIDLPGVFTFRDRSDAEALIAASREAERAIVVGGGLLGLEAAYGLARRGVGVTVVHLMGWLMERQLDAPAGALLRRSLLARGIEVLLTAETEAVLGPNRASGLRLKGGRVLAADLVVFAIGIRPEIALAREAGLAVGRGVVVDDRMTTSDPAIFAIGECAEHRGATYGLVAPLWEQASVLAACFAGAGDTRYLGSLSATSLKVTGVELFSAGQIEAGEDAEQIVYEDSEAGIYRKLVLKEGRLAGAVLLGDARDGGWYVELMRRAADIGPMRDDLVFGRDFVAAGEA